MNAMRARRFAQAMGQEAKTDAVDARVLTTMGAAVELRRVEVLPQARRISTNCRRRGTAW